MILAIFISADTAHALDDVSVKGYLKNLFSYPEQTAFSDLTLDITRLRLELKGALLPELRGEIILDNECWIGSALSSEEFRRRRDSPRKTFLKHETIVLDTPEIFHRLSTYRAFMMYNYGSGNLIVGQQRIAWGTAKLWNPTDLFNPYNPVSLERDERPGVDAIRVEHTMGPLSKIIAAYAPGTNIEKSIEALKYSININCYDISILGGRFQEKEAFGGDFSGAIGDIGIHAEGIISYDEKFGMQPCLVIGSEYAFSNSLHLLLEYYYNGLGKSDPQDYETERLLAGDIISLGRHYVGALIGYDFSGVLRGEVTGVCNVGDGSVYLHPLLKRSVTTNLDLNIGMQAFMGSTSTEYGQMRNLYYVQIQWYF